MAIKKNEKSLAARLISPICAFLVPFLIIGSINMFLIAMHGPAMPDEATARKQTEDCWFYFFFFGAIAGFIGLGVERLIRKISSRKPL